MPRCFFGLRMLSRSRSECVRALEQLREFGHLHGPRLGDLRPVPADNLHLTLAFLGDVPAEAIGGLVDAVDQALGDRTSEPPAPLRGLGVFPDWRRPRAVYARIADRPRQDQVSDLMGTVQAACAGLGFPMEDRPRVPHVTLARVRRGRGGEPWEELVGRWEARDLGHVDLTTVFLFETRPGPQGSRYVARATIGDGAGS